MKYSNIFIIILMLLVATSCVQPTRKIEVNFSVDMRKQTQVDSVGIIGQLPPLSWNKRQSLEDLDGDSIYTGSFTFDIPYDQVAFKFVLNERTIELNGKDNRQVVVKNKTSVEYKAVFDEE